MSSTNAMKRVGYGYVSNMERSIIEKLSREEKHMHHKEKLEVPPFTGKLDEADGRYAIIFTKPGCVKCRQTIRQLSNSMTVNHYQADDTAIAYFKYIGVRSKPVVFNIDHYDIIDQWCDMRTDKINQYKEAD